MQGVEEICDRIVCRRENLFLICLRVDSETGSDGDAHVAGRLDSNRGSHQAPLIDELLYAGQSFLARTEQLEGNASRLDIRNDENQDGARAPEIGSVQTLGPH